MKNLPTSRPLMALALTLALCSPLASASAQTDGDLRAFVALRSTHIGALTPLITPSMIGRQLNGAQLGIRYGFNEEAGVKTNTVAGSGIFAAGTNSSLAIHAGVSDADCVDCSPELLLGVSGDMRVIEIGDVLGSGSSLNIGVSGDVGYAQLKPGDNSALALGIGAPVALSFAGGGATGMRFVPYFTPVFGIGQINGSCVGACERNGTRWVMGGGIGVWNPLTSVSAAIGINQVLLEGQGPVYGINVIIGGR